VLLLLCCLIFGCSCFVFVNFLSTFAKPVRIRGARPKSIFVKENNMCTFPLKVYYMLYGTICRGKRFVFNYVTEEACAKIVLLNYGLLVMQMRR
jgi:hypothetical protein